MPTPVNIFLQNIVKQATGSPPGLTKKKRSSPDKYKRMKYTMNIKELARLAVI
jgi:hypothetical protein